MKFENKKIHLMVESTREILKSTYGCQVSKLELKPVQRTRILKVLREDYSPEWSTIGSIVKVHS